MFTADEVDAIAVGVRLLRAAARPEAANGGGKRACQSRAVVPDPLRAHLRGAVLRRPTAARRATGVNLPQSATRSARPAKSQSPMTTKKAGRRGRTIRPIAMAYYVDVTVVGAWCELRSDFRHFRADRILSA